MFYLYEKIRKKKYLISKGITDYDEQMKYTGSLQHDIPNLHLDKSKFLLAALRLYFEGELNSEENIRSLDNVLKYINKGNHTSEYDFNLNGLSLNELSDKYKENIRQDSENDRKRSELIQRGNNGGYNIIQINSFKEAKEYSKYTTWCVTQDENAFDNYTKGGNRFYFCLKQGFENIQQDDNGAPLNEYGLSMIAVNIDANGDLTRITTRYNHDFNGENNNGLCTVEQLEDVLDVNFYQVFKPYTREELHSMGIVMFDEVQDLLDSGKDPKDIFDYFNGFNEGVAVVKLNSKWNIIDIKGKLLYNQWFEYFGNFKEGFSIVKLNGKWNFIDTKGNLLSPNQWFDYVYYFKDGFACIKLNDKWNFIDTNGKLLSPNKWFEQASNFNEGFSVVKLNGMWNFINTKCELLSKNQWFNSVYNFHCGFGIVELNGKFNFINKKGKLLLPNLWFEKCRDFNDGFAVVELNKKWNFINKKGELLSPNQWFDFVYNFKDGFVQVKLNGKWNFIDTKGNLLSKNQWFDYCCGFKDGFSVVELNKKRYKIDIKGYLYKNN